MFTRCWQRPVVLAVAAVALATGTACAAQASPSAAAGIGHSVVAGDSSHCGKGGQGGQGGAGGRGGAPGEPGQPGQPGQPGRPGRPGGADCFRFRDLPDRPKEKLSLLDKVRIVMTVQTGQATKAEVAKKYKLSQKEIDTWSRQVHDGDWSALVGEGSLF